MADMCPGDGQNQNHGAAGLPTANGSATILDVRCRRRGDQLALGYAVDDLHEAGAANADLDLAQAGAVIFDLTTALLLTTAFAGTRITSGFSRLTIFASTLIPTRSGVSSGRPILTRKVFAIGIAGRRDLLDEAGQYLIGERVGAQQRLLADLNARDILLVDLGDDP